MQVLSEREQASRRERRCDHCGKIIRKGEKYHVQVIKDGDVYSFRSHLACWRASQIVYDAAEMYRYDEEMPLVSDMEQEDREIVAAEDQDAFIAIWGAA